MDKGYFMQILNEFPQAAQSQILSYLASDNFKAAKQLYDQYTQQKSEEKEAG